MWILVLRTYPWLRSHFRDHCAYQTNSRREALGPFWDLKSKILLIFFPEEIKKPKNLFMLMCQDYRKGNLIFCVGKIRMRLLKKFAVLNSSMRV